MNLSIEQTEDLIERVAGKIYPQSQWTPNALQHRGEKIIRRLVTNAMNKRVKEGRYFNGL
jgi:hypothetical protein